MSMKLSARFLEGVQDQEPVRGFTHDFYRYPARFSPLFAREAIRQFTRPGDTILDPFMGSGTSLVEAHMLGRNAVGTDISSLAVFLARVKTSYIDESDVEALRHWSDSLEGALKLDNPPVRDTWWIRKGYQRNVSTRTTWPIRKTLELALAEIPKLENQKLRQFARCVLLRTAQWAIDCRTQIPTAKEMRSQFRRFLNDMTAGASEYTAALKSVHGRSGEVFCLERSAEGLEKEDMWQHLSCPKLVITSPPYPGVHVLYHRWQINGRRETPAPFWIAGTLDGCGSSFYTFGDRKQYDLASYYANALASFRSLAALLDSHGVIVQMVAFADPSWQLPKYLETMREAGLEEIRPSAGGPDGRLWRNVPNRKWYASQRGETGGSREVVLFHRKKNS